MQLNQVPAGEPLSRGQMRRLLKAERAADLAAAGSEEAAVHLDETVADALQKMTYDGLTDIPVVDADGRIVNDLRLSEILYGRFATRLYGAGGANGRGAVLLNRPLAGNEPRMNSATNRGKYVVGVWWDGRIFY